MRHMRRRWVLNPQEQPGQFLHDQAEEAWDAAMLMLNMHDRMIETGASEIDRQDVWFAAAALQRSLNRAYDTANGLFMFGSFDAEWLDSIREWVIEVKERMDESAANYARQRREIGWVMPYTEAQWPPRYQNQGLG